MAKVLVVYYSKTGNTQKMAEAVAEGAREVVGVQAELASVDDTTPDHLLDADGVVFGSPVYYGAMAAPLKDLFDRSVCHHQKLTGKVAAAFASSGAVHGGNETTIMGILQACLIHGMVVQGRAGGDHYGAVSVGPPDATALDDCRDLGRRTAELTARLAAAT